MRKKEKGFSIWELLVTMIVLTILFSLIVPNFLRARKNTEVRKTMTMMREIYAAITEVTTNPEEEIPDGDIFALIAFLQSRGKHNLSPYDAWGEPFVFIKKDLQLISYGADHRPTPCDEYLHPDCDIVYVGGVFVQAPVR